MSTSLYGAPAGPTAGSSAEGAIAASIQSQDRAISYQDGGSESSSGSNGGRDGGSPDPESANEETPLCSSRKVHYNTGVAKALGLSDFFVGLEECFGLPFLATLVAVQHIVKGFVSTLCTAARRFMFAAHQVSGPQMQIYNTVAMLPWAMKPVIGLLSDAMPIFGYRKVPYMMVATIIGMTGCGLIGFIRFEHMGVLHMVGCFFCIELMISVDDLLTEAKYSSKLKSAPEKGPALMAFVWFGIYMGNLAATAMAGPVIDSFGPRMPYLLAIFPISLVFIPLLRNWIEDRPVHTDRPITIPRNLAGHGVGILCVVMLMSTLALTIAGTVFESRKVNGLVAMIVAVVVLIAFSIVLPPTIAKVNAYFLIQSALHMSIDGAVFYFFTDSEISYPEGPHFSIKFYVSCMGMLTNLFSLFGIWSYQRYAMGWSYRQLLFITNLIAGTLSWLDAAMFLRLNVKMGFPDHAFIIGANTFDSVISQWQWMPGTVLMAHLCPVGMEATMYALLAGCHNLGGLIAQNCGALLLELLGCAPNGGENESAQFENLWIASIVSSLLPGLTLLLLPFLIPSAKQTDSLLTEPEEERSLLQRFYGE
mmetsp:Transcript_80143/g.175781  ORF Transcript_80143/g.175781 Transcript_80143/m.175781 type:complete len:591 (-) Transcript_80143:28-1800(-)